MGNVSPRPTPFPPYRALTGLDMEGASKLNHQP